MKLEKIPSDSLVNVMIRKPFPQTFLETKSEFCRFLEQRGIHIKTEDLEYFEKHGFLYPIVRIIRPTFLCKKVKTVENGVTREYWQPLEEGETFEGETKKMYEGIGEVTHELYEYFKKGLLIFPSKSNFKPWKEYLDDHEETVAPFYHPCQVILVKEILTVGALTIRGIVKNKAIKKINRSWKFYEVKRRCLLRRLKEYQELICLLFLIQDRYLPFIRKKFVGRGGVDFYEFWDKWLEWTKNFDPNTILKDSGFSIEQIKDWRLHFAVRASFIDPLRYWYILVHHISYSKREKLKGDALLAQDYYEITEMLGRFLTDLTGEKQLDADDLLDGRQGRWKKKWYGRKVDYKNRKVLQKILTEYGINPQDRILLIVEGPTESECIPRIARALGIDFDQLGVKIMAMGGASESAKKRMEKLLKYLKSEPSFTIPYIILDNHPNVKKNLEILKKLKLIRPNHYRVWKTEFEEDNFSDKQVVRELIRQARKRGYNLQISIEMIEEKRQAKKREGKPIPYLTRILQDITKGNYDIYKPELGKALARIIANRIKKQEKYIPTTEIEKEILKIAKLAMH